MKARPIIKYGFYLTTRKIDLGEFRLNPDQKKEIEQIVGYCVACAQSRYNVEIYALCVMSNHIHITVRDNDANLPRFLAEVHRNIAQCINDKDNTTGPVWNRDRAGEAWLPTSEDLVEKMLYVMLNPVAAGLVPHQYKWPGLVTKPVDLLLEEGIVYERPKYYFKAGGKMPKQARLVYSIPPGWKNKGRKAFVRFLQRRIKKLEKQIARARKGKPFLGRKKILQTKPNSRPAKGTKEGGFNPAVACHDKELRIRCQSFIKNWRIEYRECYKRWRRGERNIKFPYGTYKLAWEYGVRTERDGCREAEDLGLTLPEFS